MKRNPPAPAGSSGRSLCACWLGRELRAARDAAGLTLQDAGAYLLRDTGTISRFENGRMPPRPADVGALLDLYGVQDPAKRDGLDRLSREACQPGKWDRWWSGYDTEFSRPLIDHAWLEDRASAIRAFATATIPVLVQTPEYAEAVIRADHPDADDRHIDRAIQFLAERQHVLSKQHPPRVSIILDECVLHRPIGGRDVIAGQLRHLADLADLAERADSAGAGAVELRVLPHSAGIHAARRGAFQIFDLPEPVPVAGYIDTITGPLYVEADGVDRLTRAHGELHAAALSPDESSRLIEKAAERFPIHGGNAAYRIQPVR